MLLWGVCWVSLYYLHTQKISIYIYTVIRVHGCAGARASVRVGNAIHQASSPNILRRYTTLATVSLKIVADNRHVRQIEEFLNECVEGKMLKSLLEPIRQGRVFSPSAAKSDIHESNIVWVEGTSRSAVGECECNVNASWRKLKSSKDVKTTQKCQRNIRVWQFPVFEHNVNAHKMFCCHFQRERSSNCRPYVNTKTTTNVKNTRKKGICLWTQAAF